LNKIGFSLKINKTTRAGGLQTHFSEERHDPNGKAGFSETHDRKKPETRGEQRKGDKRNMGNSSWKDSRHCQKGKGRGDKGHQHGINRSTDRLKCFYTNIDSILNKRDELLSVIHRVQPDVICVNEILPKNFRFGIQVSEIKIDGFNCFTNLESESPGKRGIAMYVREQYKAQQVELNSEHRTAVESVWTEIKLQENDSLLIGTMYRSPNSTKDNDEQINKVLKDMSKNRSHFLVVGDFNFPELDWIDGTSPPSVRHKATMFMDTVRDAFLHQHVVQPTHYRAEQNATLIDLILTNEESMVKNIEHRAPIGKSHHQTLIFEFVCYTSRNTSGAQTKLSFKNGDYSSMRKEFVTTKMNEKLQGMTTQQAWDTLAEEILRLTDKHVPKVNLGRIKKKPLWLNEKTMAKVKKKSEAYKRYMETREGKEYLQYAKARNQAKKACKQAVKDFEKEIAKTAKTNPKAFYSYFKSKLKTQEGVADLKDSDGNVASTDEQKANILNSFFCSVFTHEDKSSIPGCGISQGLSFLEDMDIEEDKVKKLLKTVNVTKSQGPDCIHPRILQELADELAAPLTYVFKTSLNEGVLPAQWKWANVTPLFKKGSKSKPENYRPVSLTSIPCKLMEKLVRDELFKHLDSNEILTKCQHGFVPNRSCVTNLLEVLDKWTESLDNSIPVDAIYLDFAKAFDTVPHERLLHKLENYGVSGRIKDWIKDFLFKRQQRVKVGGSMSEWAEVVSGVPQGSVLGPVLFAVFINDLPDVVESFCSMYADDTKIYRQVDSPEESSILQKDLDSLVEWAEQWQMNFNASKCKVLHLGRKQQKFTYNMRNKDGNQMNLESTECEKDLGIHIDSDLNFSKHTETQVNKANRILGMIRRSYEYIDSSTMKLLFCALVRPHLEFASTVWSPRYEKDKILIEKVLRRATKCVPGMSELEYEDRLKAMQIPSMSYRRIRGDLIEMYKFTHNMYNCENPFEFHASEQTRGHSFKLLKQRCKTTLRQQYFSYRVLETWNSLDEKIVTATSINAFKNAIDRHFQDIVYSQDISHPVKGQGQKV
jgi:exonuclease III